MDYKENINFATKTLLFSAAFFATIAASAQTIVWPSTVNRETKEANLSATVTGSETITATDITLGADIKIGDKDGANAVTAVKNTTGENLQFPSETEGMISWRPINGNVDDAEATADLAEGAGAYIDFTIEEGDINKTFAGMSSFEFDVTKVGTDATRINVKLIGEGDTNVDTGWLINADNAKSFGDEYQADYDAEAKNKDYPWDEAANGYNPSRNDGSKGVSGGANANGISHVKLAVPAEFAASNPYKVTLRIAIIKCANNKDLAVNAVTFNFGDSTTPVEEEKVYSVIGTLNGNWDVDTDMKLEDGLYTVTFENIAAGTYEWKIRQDHDWTINWGDNGDGTGVQDGPNFIAELPEGSSMKITFDPATATINAYVVGGVLPPDGNDAIWENDGAKGAISWSSDYRFASEEKKTGEEIYAVPMDVWEKMKTTPFFVDLEGENPQIRVTTGWWDGDATYTGNDITPGNELLTDNGEGKWTLKVDLTATQALLDLVDDHHLLFTGDRYTPVKIYFAESTAIKAVKAAQDSDAIYNIAGQKVNASYKGLVIKNGKKYIQK